MPKRKNVSEPLTVRLPLGDFEQFERMRTTKGMSRCDLLREIVASQLGRMEA